MNLPQPAILIRECRGFDEFDRCVRLQTDVWGYDVRDTIPLREFIVIQRIGGQVLGAFDVEKSADARGCAAGMIGFAMSMPGVNGPSPYLHSHMLAVLPEYRNCGIGRKLKLAQRDDALARGLKMMEWTFDPLEIKNAYLNIAKLGAVVRSYTPNFYGVFSSRLQGGLPTDRLHAEWWMDSPRVRETIAGGPVALPEILETIAVPGKIREWKQSPETIDQAEAVQTAVRERFLDAFQRGLAVVNVTRGPASGGDGDGIYHLAEWHES